MCIVCFIAYVAIFTQRSGKFGFERWRSSPRHSSNYRSWPSRFDRRPGLFLSYRSPHSPHPMAFSISRNYDTNNHPSFLRKPGSKGFLYPQFLLNALPQPTNISHRRFYVLITIRYNTRIVRGWIWCDETGLSVQLARKNYHELLPNPS